MWDNLEGARKRFADITARLSDPAVTHDRELYRQLMKEHAELSPVMAAYERYRKVEGELASQEQIVADPQEDPDLKALAESEIPALRKAQHTLSEELKLLLVPKDPLDNSNIVMEIRAGTGGEEAALFAADLFRMYSRYAEKQGWKTELLSSSPSSAGGFKEVILGIEGNEVYKKLKHESGVHRVQRVPQTETQGRIHTSAATVAVLPEADEIEIELNMNDVRVDVFRSSGPGGQSVNTTDSAVRMTHVPTGIVAQSQDEKSQHKNKAKALKVLKARIYEKMREEQLKKQGDLRRSMVGTGDRSERIRTYNFPQSRLTDHRIGLTIYRLEQVIEGELGEVIDALVAHDQAERLKQGSDAVQEAPAAHA
ncbi:MAG: peptide chain release factor 1 [SAR324 cluster bacterium]